MLREPPPLLECAALLPPLHERLLELLRALPARDWERPTRAGAWRVRDVAAHLLDGELRDLSFRRDAHQPPPPTEPIDGYQPLLRFLDRLNHEWVAVSARLSPRVIVDLLDWAGPQVSSFMAGLDPFAEALFPVAWAGEERSLNWMDVAREYTERWHHQQQIREAVGAPLLEEPFFLLPLLHTSVRALPRAYAATEAAPGTEVVVAIEGPAGGEWTLRREAAGWTLLEGAAAAPAARLAMDERYAWRLFFKALSEDERRGGITATGDSSLAAPLRGALAVMA